MLTITAGTPAFDNDKGEFVVLDPIVLQLEHSLVSLSKWESIHHKHFLDNADLTTQESISYIECMILSPEIPPGVLAEKLTEDNYREIQEYMADAHTATTFRERLKPQKSREFITSELIYFYMNSLNIPIIPCETWHLNRLLTLIKVHQMKNTKPQKLTGRDRAALADQYRSLNDQRRRELGTNG